MNAEKVREIKKVSHYVRKSVIEMIHRAGSGHTGGSLSVCEILAFLYFSELKIDPANPKDPDRDRFILSKGHAAPALYSVLAKKGYFPEGEMEGLRRTGSMLQGHPDMSKVPGVEISSGSLGMGISFGIGTALGAKKSGRKYRTWVVTGCGELDEGQNWEAFMSAPKFGLDNLTVIIDYNKVQLDGTNDDIMPLSSLAKKLEAFRWNVICCDGHDIEALADAAKRAKEYANGPSVIIADTIKGKGVSFMEHKNSWHGKTIDDEAYKKAMEELDAK